MNDFNSWLDDLTKTVRSQVNPEPEEKNCPEGTGCEGGGWVLSSYQAVGAPNFEACPICGNPEGLSSP